MKGYRGSVVHKGPPTQYHVYCKVMECYPLVLGVLMKKHHVVGASARGNSLSSAIEMLMDLLRTHINTDSYKETCESLCEGLKMIDDDDNNKVVFVHRMFSDLMELPYLNTERTPYNVNIKVVLIKTAQRILKDLSYSVGKVSLSPGLKRKAMGVVDRILSSSKSTKLSREANHLKSELLLISAVD